MQPEEVARREQVDLVINSLLAYAAKFKLRLMLNEYLSEPSSWLNH